MCATTWSPSSNSVASIRWRAVEARISVSTTSVREAASYSGEVSHGSVQLSSRLHIASMSAGASPVTTRTRLLGGFHSASIGSGVFVKASAVVVGLGASVFARVVPGASSSALAPPASSAPDRLQTAAPLPLTPTPASSRARATSSSSPTLPSSSLSGGTSNKVAGGASSPSSPSSPSSSLPAPSSLRFLSAPSAKSATAPPPSAAEKPLALATRTACRARREGASLISYEIHSSSTSSLRRTYAPTAMRDGLPMMSVVPKDTCSGKMIGTARKHTGGDRSSRMSLSSAESSSVDERRLSSRVLH